MRRSLPRFATYLVVAFTVTALTFTGCQTGSSFKMPGSDWISSWGKKKPSNSSLSSARPDTNLPQPPSTTQTPYQAPSYAQGPGGRSGYGTNRWDGSQQGGLSATTPQRGYGTHPSNSQYANSGYGAASANYDSATTRPNYAPGGTDTSRGFYNPNYNTGGAQPATPGLRSAGQSPYAGGYGNDTYSSTHAPRPQNTYPTNSSPVSTGQSWTDRAQNSSQYSQTTPSQYDTGTSQTQPARGTPAYTYDSPTPSRGSDYSSGAPSAFPGSRAGDYSNAATAQQYGQDYGREATSNARNAAPGTIASDGYRPGTTSRTTQFGDSRNVDVGSARAIQRAWFGDAGEGTARSSVSDASGGQPPANGGSTPRTATEAYPYTTPSNYR